MKYEIKYDLSFLESDLRELLKKLKKHNTYAMQLENEIILYKLENTRLKESEEYHRKGYAELHQKIEQAIEYIEKQTKELYKNWDIENFDFEELLNILKGADKE